MSKLASEWWIMTLTVIFLLIAAFMAASQRDDLKAEAVKRGSNYALRLGYFQRNLNLQTSIQKMYWIL